MITLVSFEESCSKTSLEEPSYMNIFSWKTQLANFLDIFKIRMICVGLYSFTHATRYPHKARATKLVM